METDRSPPRHPIGVVSRRTGLKPPVIRAWERRHAAIEPRRDDNGHRLYSDGDIERLLLLREVTRHGWSIGQVAKLPNPELEELLETAVPNPRSSGGPSSFGEPPPGAGAGPSPGPSEEERQEDPTRHLVEVCLSCLRRLDLRSLEVQLERSLLSFDRGRVLERVLVPFLERVAGRWRDGTLHALHETVAYGAARSFLSRLGGERGAPDAPHLVLATPRRQFHELGTLMAAAVAAASGWQTSYLGPGLAPEDLASVARAVDARAVALGVTYPVDDALLTEELRRLRGLLTPEIRVLLGGRAARAYGTEVEGVEVVDGLDALRRTLAGRS